MNRASLVLCLLLGLVGLQPSPQRVAAQATGTVTGIVTTELARPLAGVAVSVVGTGRGSTTGSDGRFRITGVPAGTHTLRATTVGYTEATRQVTVGAGQTATADLRLDPAAVQLEGLVATGYATTRRSDVTGAVTQVRAENLANRPVTGATQALVAQVPGVQVVTSTGAPGSGAQVRIRGMSAVGAGSTPLYVVDGFPITSSQAGGTGTGSQTAFTLRNPLNDIPPQDIESITVLKDASAAAIYGSRASNGVVIITTKRGRGQDGARVDINAYSGMQSIDYSRFPQMANATEFATFMNRRYRQLNNGSTAGMPAEWANPSAHGTGTDWFREITEAAPMHNVTASVSGGAGRIRSYFSAGYLDQQGTVLNTGYQRATLRANLEANLGERLTVGLNLAPTYSLRKLSVTGGTNRSGAFGSAMVAWPTDSPRAADGDSLVRLVRGHPSGLALPNPILELGIRENDQRNLRALGGSHVNFRVAEGIELATRLNMDWQDTDTDNFAPSGIWTNAGPTIPSGNFATGTYLNWLSESTVNVDRAIGRSSRIQAVAGFSLQHEQEQEGTFNGSLFPDDDIRTLNAAQTVTVSGIREDEWSLASWLARVNYTLLDRYVLTATVRTDGSSRFGSENRWGTFPSAALAWNFAQEPVLERFRGLSDGKLRLSLGFTGNNQIGNYPSLGVVNRNDYVFGNVQAAGRDLATLQNPALGWERTRELNAGLDLGFLDNRVTMTADAYQRRTEDLLLNLELPQASGFTQVVANQGAIQNTGFELGVNTTNLERERFRWESNVVLSVNRNKALDLGASDTLRSGASMEAANTHISIVGRQLAQFFGYRIIGVYTAADIANACVPGRPTPGCVAVFAGARESDVRFKDVNGDGVIRQTEDFEVIGNPWPDFTFGLTNTVTAGPVELRVVLDGQRGGQRLNRNLASIENIDGIFNVTRAYVRDMWISPDSTGNGKTPSAGASSPAGRRAFRDVSDRWVEDASYLWIRNVMLGMDLPGGMLRGARRGRLYLSVENPYVFSGFHGNPQTETAQILAAQGAPGTPNLTPGVDELTYPIARTLTIGVDLGL